MKLPINTLCKLASIFNYLNVLALICYLQAQVWVEVSFDKDQYLPFEPVTMEVKITNFSGQTLRMGEDPQWIEILIENKEGSPVREISKLPVVYPFEIPNASRGIRRFNITPYFEIYTPGQYTVRIAIQVRELGYRVEGKSSKFVVIPASPMWEQSFGYIPKDGKGYEVRRYGLLQVHQGRRTLLYVRVANEDATYVYRIFPIGVFLTFSRPETQLDKDALLHILWQTGGREFSYVVIDPEGNLVKQETYEYFMSRPKLVPTEDGGVRVGGGILKVKSNSPSSAPEPENKDNRDSSPVSGDVSKS